MTSLISLVCWICAALGPGKLGYDADEIGSRRRRSAELTISIPETDWDKQIKQNQKINIRRP